MWRERCSFLKVLVLCMLTAGVTTAAQNGAANQAPAEAQRPNIMGKLTTAKKTIAVFGQPIVYYEAGRGRTLVLPAQLGWDSHMWSRNMPALAENYHVIAIDLLGTGESAPNLISSTRWTRGPMSSRSSSG